MPVKPKLNLEIPGVVAQLSELLRVERKPRVHVEPQQGGCSDNVYKVTIWDRSGNSLRVVLKEVDDSRPYVFYKETLEPLELDSPRMYGHIEADGRLLLVMEYIDHEPTTWNDEKRYELALKWLIRKDRVIHDHFQTVAESSYMKTISIGPPFLQRVEYCLRVITDAADSTLSSVLPTQFLNLLTRNESRLYELATRVSKRGRLTVAHYDLQMGNILFKSAKKKLLTFGKKKDVIYVIDWAEPKIDSVCVDLIGLVHIAPHALRQRLVDSYRREIDFVGFGEIYRDYELLLDLSELGWMAEMMADQKQAYINLAEFERKAKELHHSLSNI